MDGPSCLTLSKTPSAIPYIYGFKDAVYPREIEQILLKLLEFTRTEQVVWLDEELGLLRAAVPGIAIELYYPASTSPQIVEYLNVDQMPARIGMTFRELLEMQARVGLGRPKQAQRTRG